MQESTVRTMSTKQFTKIQPWKFIVLASVLFVFLTGSWLVWVLRHDILYALYSSRAVKATDPDSRRAALLRIDGLALSAAVSEQPIFKIHNDADLAAPLAAVLAQDDESGNRQLAAQALAHMGPLASAAAEQLCESLRNDSSADVRSQVATAIHCLFAIDQSSPDHLVVVPVLLHALENDPDSRVKAACAEGVAWILSEQMVQSRPAGVSRTIQETNLFDEALSKLVERMCDDADAYVRASAAHAIGTMGSRAMSAREALVIALRSDLDARVREYAVSSLGAFACMDAELWDVIHAASRKDTEGQVRLEAFRTIAQQKPSNWTGSLATALSHDVNEDVRAYLARMLGQLNPKPDNVVSALQGASTSDPSPTVRRLAQNALLGSFDSGNCEASN